MHREFWVIGLQLIDLGSVALNWSGRLSYLFWSDDHGSSLLLCLYDSCCRSILYLTCHFRLVLDWGWSSLWTCTLYNFHRLTFRNRILLHIRTAEFFCFSRDADYVLLFLVRLRLWLLDWGLGSWRLHFKLLSLGHLIRHNALETLLKIDCKILVQFALLLGNQFMFLSTPCGCFSYRLNMGG